MVYGVVGSYENAKSPSLTLLDVALSWLELDGSVGGVTSCWLVREFEESLADASGFLLVFHAIDLSPG